MDLWDKLTTLTDIAGLVVLSGLIAYCYWLYKKKGDIAARRIIPGILLIDCAGLLFLVRDLALIPSFFYSLAKWGGVGLALAGMLLVRREWRRYRGRGKREESGRKADQTPV